MTDNEIRWADLHKGATTVLEGEFPVVVVEAVATKSSGGKPMIKAKVRIESGTFVGRQLYHNFNITADNPAAMRIFFGQMSVFGLDAAYWKANPSAPVEQIAQALLNRKAVAVVGGREWNGTMREEIKEWKRAVGGPGGGAVGSPFAGAVATPAAGGFAAATPPTPPPAQQLGAQPNTEPPPDPFA